MTTKTTAGRGAVWSIALLLVAIENSAAVPRVLCKLVPLYRQTQPCFPGIFCLGVVRHLATFTSVALKPVSIGLRHARLLPSTMKEPATTAKSNQRPVRMPKVYQALGQQGQCRSLGVHLHLS
jgi:hypothetical protein